MGNHRGFAEPVKGYILVTVMAFLLLASLLTLGVMETTVLQQKQANIQQQFWQFTSQAAQANEHILQALQKKTSLNCFASYSPEDRYWNTAANGWHASVCQETQKNSRSDSVIEILPPIFCQNKTQWQIYRLTTQTQTPSNRLLKIQSTIILPNLVQKTCTQHITQLSSGLQSWRIG